MSFERRHIGPGAQEQKEMLKSLGFESLNDLARAVVPNSIYLDQTPRVRNAQDAQEEFPLLSHLKSIAQKNQLNRSFIGMGYYGTITPGVILRNILENPGWYTQYTPYQAEISQGRLEALLNFQTLITDLTGLQISNASLLDEGTAAAEAMTLCFATKGDANRNVFFVADGCLPQTLDVVLTRAAPLGIQVVRGPYEKAAIDSKVFAVLLQYPCMDGHIPDYQDFIQRAHAQGAMVVMAADLLSLVMLKSPGELGADVAVGSAQRFGVPMGFGGPHAAYFATKEEFTRRMPGRLIGVSKDAEGHSAYRLALQTREQHIRRDKATSNICTSQVLLAIMASMYAVYHGPEGLKEIARRVHQQARALAKHLEKLGYKIREPFFDTLCVEFSNPANVSAVLDYAKKKKVNLLPLDGKKICVSLDETVSNQDLELLSEIFSLGKSRESTWTLSKDSFLDAAPFKRNRPFLTHPVFNTHHSETEMLRYIKKLESRDLSLAMSMIPLGSCTMKLNATSEMIPVSWPEFGGLHPFVPEEQAQGYQQLTTELEEMLADLTGFDAVSLQPNAGSQGEYAGLLVIQKYHQTRGSKRDVCLIPKSAHGTNPASAALAGMRVVVVECDERGNVDLEDLKRKAEENAAQLSALMVTYPSTHGVFEEKIREICEVVHRFGGQVYMDGANMNAQIGLCKPGQFGPDVCHLNLHKTFCIPHGGGGPGMGPICVKSHLAPHLPNHVMLSKRREMGMGAVSAAPFGSASILPISWVYISLMGAEGLRRATQVAILNANYVAKKLDPYYPVLYKGESGWVAHECIVDLRKIKAATGIEVEDVAKRLMDYGFHAPTISFPVPGTMMIEPTESESKAELDRFCEALILIRKEIEEIEKGQADPKNNLLKNAPHTAAALVSDRWERPYSRERAAFPAPWTKSWKFWPSVARIDGVYGDRNLVCACPSIEEYT